MHIYTENKCLDCISICLILDLIKTNKQKTLSCSELLRFENCRQGVVGLELLKLAIAVKGHAPEIPPSSGKGRRAS